MSLFHTPLSHSSIIKSVCVGALGTRRLTPQCTPRPGRAILRSQVCIQEVDLHTVVPSSDLEAAPYPENVAIVPLGLVLSPAQYANGPRKTHVHWALDNRHTDLEPGCWLWSSQWTSSSQSQHSLGAAEGKPTKLGQAVDYEKTLYLGSSQSQLQSICNLAGTSGDPERPCTRLQLPHSHSLSAILSIQSLSRRRSHLCTRRFWNGLILDLRSLLATVSEQSCWHSDLAGDTPSCAPQDPEEPYTQLQPHHNHTLQAAPAA